jgi:hypothetical protein
VKGSLSKAKKRSRAGREEKRRETFHTLVLFTQIEVKLSEGCVIISRPVRDRNKKKEMEERERERERESGVVKGLK